jgi:hypothetical protein
MNTPPNRNNSNNENATTTSGSIIKKKRKIIHTGRGRGSNTGYTALEPVQKSLFKNPTKKGEVSPFATVFVLRYPPLRGSDPRNAPGSQRRIASPWGF